MAEEQDPQSWWRTLPGTLTALAGVITAVATLIGVLSQSGVFDREAKSATRPVAPVSSPAASSPAASAPATSAPATSAPAVSAPRVEETRTHPSEQTTDGWTIIGKSKQGKFYDLNLMIHGDSPAIGRRYDAVEDFRLVHKRPERGERQGQVITLGMVHRGDSVEILDLYIEAPSTEMVPVWAKLRAVLHKR